MLQVDHITKYYGETCAVRDLSFSVPDHGVVGLLGRNGAGKSTTMNIITGYLSPSDGKVTLNGSGTLHGRIFAKEIEITSESLTIAGGNLDLAARGFTKPTVTTSTTVTTVTTVTTADVTTTEAVTTDTEPDVTTDTSAEIVTTDTTADTTTTETVTSTGTDTTDPDPTTTVTTKTTPAYTQAQYEYDKLGRLTKVIYDEKNYIEYTYDANGNITEVKKTTNGITKE